MSDSAQNLNAFSAKNNFDNSQKKKLSKSKIILPLILIGSLLLGLGGYLAYRSNVLQGLRTSENTFASFPSGLEVEPTSGNWNKPEKFRIKNVGSNQVTVSWFLDCWDTKVCSDSVGNSVLSPGQSFEQGLGYICSKWQLDITTKPVNPPWQSPNDIPDNFQWEWGGVSEKSNTCTQTPVPTANPTGTPVATPVITPNGSPSGTPKSSGTPKPTATPTGTPVPSGSPPIGGPSSTPTSVPTATPTGTPVPTASPTPGPTEPGSTPTPTPGPTNPPTEVANATSTPQPEQPTAVANAEQLPKAGIESYTNYLIFLAILALVTGVGVLRKKKTY